MQAFCGEHVNLEFAQTSGCAPLTLVQRARNELRANKRAPIDDRFDEICCVFDNDNHANINQALSEARDAGILIAYSNPCFELWLVWHVEDWTAHVERDVIQRHCRDLGLTQGKHIRAEATLRLQKGFPTAKRRAKRLDKARSADGSRYGANPHSDVWRLVDLLQDQK